MEPLASEMTKEPSSWSETRGGAEAKAIGQVIMHTKTSTQDVEFQLLRIPYIQGICICNVDRQSKVVVVNQLKNKLI